MSSRRITSNPTLAPIQRNALNPFSEFNSDNINLLTRIVSGGNDVIIKGLDVTSADETFIYKTDNLLIGPGKFPEVDEDGTVEKIGDTSGYNMNIKEGLMYGISYIEWNLNNITDILSSNKEREFEVSFKLTSGKPKCIFITMNDDTSYVIDHPIALDNNEAYTFIVKRNLCNDKNQVRFRFNVLFDVLESWNMPTNIPIEAYQSESKFSRQDSTIISVENITCCLVNYKYNAAKNTTFNSNNYYFDKDIHPTSTLKITPGIAIKDDVMLDIKGKTYAQQDASVILNLRDNNSWIKGTGFDVGEFVIYGDNQFAYRLNGREEPQIGDNNNSLPCSIGPDGKMKVNIDQQTTIDLLDDNDYLDGDEELPNNSITYTLDKYAKTIQVSLNSDYQLQTASSGSHLVFVYENINESIKETFFVLDAILEKDNNILRIKSFDNVTIDYSKLSQKIVEWINGIPQTNANALKDRITIYLSSGPIKILSKPGYYNESFVKWAYVVLYYAYFKNPRPNISYIGLAKEEEVKDPKFREDYLILAKVRFIDQYTIDIISYNERQVATFPSSNSINYFNDCVHPEVWQNSAVPRTVAQAIDQLRSEVNDLKYLMRKFLENNGDVLVSEDFTNIESNNSNVITQENENDSNS